MAMKEASMEVFHPEQRGTIIQLVKEQENNFSLFVCKKLHIVKFRFCIAATQQTKWMHRSWLQSCASLLLIYIKLQKTDKL